jgi:hypothetical protein
MLLFAYCKYHGLDFAADAAKTAADPLTRDWWAQRSDDRRTLPFAGRLQPLERAEVRLAAGPFCREFRLRGHRPEGRRTRAKRSEARLLSFSEVARLLQTGHTIEGGLCRLARIAVKAS